MKTRPLVSSVAFVLLTVGTVVACGSSASDRTFGDPDKKDDKGPPPTPGLGGGDSSVLMVPVNVTGTVFAPNGTLPLSNALVYLASELPAPIPDGVYCDTCVKLQDGTFATSGADGTFTISTTMPKGKVYVITQKGQFRRVREVNITAEGTVAIPNADTTLPGKSDPKNNDDIPNMVVLKDDADFDPVDESLNKLGITGFDIKNDRALLQNDVNLDKYHIVFIPCGNSTDDNMTDAKSQANLQNYVAKGGKLYVTDWSYEFVRQPFPGWFNWAQETAEVGSAATGDEWDADATATDQGLADWLAATGDPTFKVEGNWTTITSVNTNTGKDPQGNDIDITPKVWVMGDKAGQPTPTTVSFENQCGRVLFSSYHTENSKFGSGSGLSAQEKALLYVLLEVGVCVGDRPTEK